MTRSFFSVPCVLAASGLVVSACLLTGCAGGDEFSTAPVSGTVMFNGKPVSGGTVMLTPVSEGESEMPGKGAAARVQEDGSFVLTTYEEGDGAILGKHIVSYNAPISTDTAPAGAHGGPPQSPYAGAKPKEPEVEITSGENELTIELVK